MSMSRARCHGPRAGGKREVRSAGPPQSGDGLYRSGGLGYHGFVPRSIVRRLVIAVGVAGVVVASGATALAEDPASARRVKLGAAPAAAPAPEPTAGVFDGRAGDVRGIAYVLSASSLLLGVGFLGYAMVEHAEAREMATGITKASGYAACAGTAGASAADCLFLVQKYDLRDVHTRWAQGFFAAAGVLAAGATVSIWIVRTPETPKVEAKATMLPGGGVLSLRASW